MGAPPMRPAQDMNEPSNFCPGESCALPSRYDPADPPTYSASQYSAAAQGGHDHRGHDGSGDGAEAGKAPGADVAQAAVASGLQQGCSISCIAPK